MVFNSETLYLNRAKFVMKFLGVWVPPEDEMLILKLYRIFMITLQYLFLFFQVIFIIQVWGDLDAVSQASYLLFTQACLCFKVTVFLVNKRTQTELLKQMKSKVFMPQTFSHEKILNVQATRIKRFLLAFMISSQMTCGMWALKPLFDDAGSRKFPFDMWMPVGPEKSPHFHFGYAFQFLTISMSAYMYFGVDSVVLSSVIFACAQIDIIKDKILSIETVWDERGSEKAKTMSKNYIKLIECIKHHQAVITFIKLIEGAYHTYLLFQLTGSVGLICMSALRILVVPHTRLSFPDLLQTSYLATRMGLTGSVGLICMSALRILVVEVKSVQFVSIVTYLSVMISQLFVCCWCGNELTSTSAELHTVLYQSTWYEQSQKFQKDLAFAMMRMSRPLVLKAGHYIPLLRQTFISILRMSYSYFAVLNQTT